MSIFRLFVEKKTGYNLHAIKIKQDLKDILNINADDIKFLIRYDIEGIDFEDLKEATSTVFSEPTIDNVYFEEYFAPEGYHIFATEFLPGQYDQKADSSEQCVQLLTRKARPKIKCANIYALSGVTDKELVEVKKLLINPVESREADLSKPQSLKQPENLVEKEKFVQGFINLSNDDIANYHKEQGFAMTTADLIFVRDYFIAEKRDPSITELKVIDTYWSDHCRHTTFLTRLSDIKISGSNEDIKKSYDKYIEIFNDLYKDRKDKYPCLMDMATIGAKQLKLEGHLNDLDESDEINACSIKVKAIIDDKEQDWLVMFKNETHNHPTEIEPFGGAATCLGGAIRDPLSGRSYVYHAMRVTGCGDPFTTLEDTPKGKLMQRVITKTAALGFASYGNQIGLATGIVAEIYYNSYVAKRMEAGFVVGAAPLQNVIREKPEKGDVIVLLGGDTGRDGCGGATGSSKAHDISSVETCGAEVQKGNPLTERKIQRLFTKTEVTRLIKKCNDFGAGGVCVAIGELADSLEIDLNAVPKKYDGLSGTEIAISESQERMAVVIAKENVQRFIEEADKENVNAVVVAKVTDTNRLIMKFNSEIIVDLSREFLNSNGAEQQAEAEINENVSDYILNVNKNITDDINKDDFKAAVLKELSRLNVCSQKGLGEIFDSTIGSGSVYLPFGGKTQLTPAISMAAKLPVQDGYTDNCTVSSFAYYPYLSVESPYAGSTYAVVSSVAKLIASGADRCNIRLTLQEYFPRLYNDKLRWGLPLSALLGALSAQLGLKTAAIGGKDSMSGTFEDIDVPPTLISFALAFENANNLITNVLSKTNEKLYQLKLKRNKNNICDFDYVNKLYDTVSREIKNKNIQFATVVEEGGAVSAVIKSCFGNEIGFSFNGKEQLFYPLFGDIIISSENIQAFDGFDVEYIGFTTDDGYKLNGQSITIEQAKSSFTGTLEKIFPTSKQTIGKAQNITEQKNDSIYNKRFNISTNKPKVLIPVFPGTNCEYDTARKFAEQGADVTTFVVRNRTQVQIEDSVKELSKLIGESQIIAFPGGFSGGDEPDGSGKFIATTFKNPYIKESVANFMNKTDGLMLGICNGFQALIKLCLVPEGQILNQTNTSPTLSYNVISRHVSSIVKIRVASNKSPWLSAVNVGDVFDVAISHGEGRFICSDDKLEELISNGQIATQYVDFTNNATLESPYNPNGSTYAVEGITSPCGRILGKMGHSERTGINLYKNYQGNFDMKIFESGVKFFK